jgi:hypothetical protein
MVRAARRERAPEDIVRSLPWRVWTGTGWEKHSGGEIPPPAASPGTVEEGRASSSEGHNLGVRTSEEVNADPSSSLSAEVPTHEREGTAESIHPPWAETQNECAICLSEFEVGDRVRVLPCDHIFHMDEVDGWLIHNKKLVR